jgi:hypothetical protein
MPATDRDLWGLLCTWGEPSAVAVIEQVCSSPQMGVTSAFTFGCGYGKLLMALTAAGIPFETKQPRVWQASLQIPPRVKHNKTRKVQNRKGKWVDKKYGGETDTQWKDRLRAKAQQLFPRLDLWDQALAAQRAVCDALLIAEYCRRVHATTNTPGGKP